MRRTKVVCTIGPASGAPERVAALTQAGMNVARINCSHGDWETRGGYIKAVRAASGTFAPTAILADLAGPKFRLGMIEGNQVRIETGSTVTVGDKSGATLPIDQPEIVNALAPGDRILLGDGEVEIRLVSGSGGAFVAEVVAGGLVGSRKGVTVVGKSFNVPSLTDKDLQDIKEAAEAGADYIALSYVRDAGDMRALRREVDRYDPTIRLCAKIETPEALQNIDDIIKVADLIMVARGDLGLQMDIEDVPAAQKKIVKRCNVAAKPAIVATQMLESMMHAARPTRAEATDVVNAIVDGCDAVMLSGETAAGEYPIECVKTIARLAEKAEQLARTNGYRPVQEEARTLHQTEAVAHSATELAEALRAKAIVISTTSGQTARFISKFRPNAPILCAAWDAKVRAQMAAIWGVETVALPLPKTTDECVASSLDAFVHLGKLRVGDVVVITAGVPPGLTGHTNMIMAQTIS